jgi:uncharacterized protein (TIGR03084 family)
MQQAYDYLAEVEELSDLLRDQQESVFLKRTLFKSWTVNDIIGHLYMFDLAAVKALQNENEFAKIYLKVSAHLDQGMSILESQYPFLKGLSGKNLFEQWYDNSKKLGAAFACADPSVRLKWFGPEMSAKSSITARQMETWAHGQEIFDALGVKRAAHDRIKNICHLGVATFGWSFTNRSLKVPDRIPHVRLISPSGKIWEWGDSSSQSSIKGKASEFAEVVTQVRNVQDTKLKSEGAIAKNWMKIAQCFAGQPENPPIQGSRFMVPRTNSNV